MLFGVSGLLLLLYHSGIKLSSSLHYTASNSWEQMTASGGGAFWFCCLTCIGPERALAVQVDLEVLEEGSTHKLGQDGVQTLTVHTLHRGEVTATARHLRGLRGGWKGGGLSWFAMQNYHKQEEAGGQARQRSASHPTHTLPPHACHCCRQRLTFPASLHAPSS